MTGIEPKDHELVAQLKRLRYDLTAMQAKVTELLAMAGRAKLEAPNTAHVCPECGIDRRSATMLAEHRYVSHDGPLPAHYTAAENHAA